MASLINQMLMVAADVDNDFLSLMPRTQKMVPRWQNLTYRITALYSGRDAVLGASAGLKHFGVRRLGRSGLAVNPPTMWTMSGSGLLQFFRPSGRHADSQRLFRAL